jgi:hypothetical protein
MQQYLLNTTAIWLLSLIVFDVFLSRENYHRYNRFFLLFTLLLGALLPLLQWSYSDSTALYPVLHQPIERVVAAKQTIAITSSPSISWDWAQWLAIVYVSGALVSLGLFASEVVKLLRFYKTGTKTVVDGWSVIETGKEHAPFSFRDALFVGSKSAYTNEEWQLILRHEQRHSVLLHIADLLLLHLARIAFWFHPLVYVYGRRLLLVHEYQADSAAAEQPVVYGKFLIEQAVHHAAPTVAHSFNRSPIKNRIIMLTRTSSIASKSKMLVLLPVLFVAISCFTNNYSANAQKMERKGNAVTHKGNKITLSEPQYDTMIVVDPVTGDEMMKIRSTDPEPETINGKRIYRYDAVTTPPQPYASKGTIESYLLTKLADDLGKLPDGIYRIELHQVVIDEKGKVIYYNYAGIVSRDKGGKAIRLPEEVVKKLDNKINTLMENAPAMMPATLNGEKVTAMANVYMQMNKIEVTNHTATYTKSPPGF